MIIVKSRLLTISHNQLSAIKMGRQKKPKDFFFRL